MKLSFAEIGSGSNFITITCGTKTRQFLEDYNVSLDVHLHYDDIRLPEDTFVYVNDIESFLDIKHFCKKYCCSITFYGDVTEIEFFNLHEDDIPKHFVWDYKDYSLSELEELYDTISTELDGIWTDEQEEKLTVMADAIDWLKSKK